MRIVERLLVLYVMQYLSRDCLTQHSKLKRLTEIRNILCEAVACQNRTNQTVIPIKPRKPLHHHRSNQIMAERSELSIDPRCMKFRIQPAVIHIAELHVHIKTKQKKNRKNKRQKRITIIVEKLATDKTKSTIIRKRFIPNATRYYKLNLPSGNGLQQPQHIQQQSLHLCIYCPRCKRQVSITLPTRRKKRKNKKNKGNNKKNKRPVSTKHKRKRKNKKSVRTLRKKRPYIVLKNFNLSRKRSRRHLSLCSLSRDKSACCVDRKFVAFKDIGLHRYISHPKGFYKTECAEKCKRNIMYNDLNNSSMQNKYLCKPSYYKDLRLLVTVGNSVQMLTVPNGDITQCSCERRNL